jgi:hypothetical protein
MERLPDELKSFIDTTIWTFAKTMPDWPHHYIVRNKVDENLFVRLVEHIRRFGYQGWFYKKQLTYFDEDGFMYWTMGNPIDETTVINRARKEGSYENRLKNGTLPKHEET